MAEAYPIPMPERLHHRLPTPAADGLVYVDVKVKGVWDGILVVDSARGCIGIHLEGRVQEYPLPFEMEEVEDCRRPSLANWTLAWLSRWVDGLVAILIAVWIVCPVLLLLGSWASPWFYLAAAALAAVSLRIVPVGMTFMFGTPTAGMAAIFLLSGSLHFIRAMR